MQYFATLGPNSHSVEVLEQLFQTGMTGVRLNLSHGDLESAKDWIACLVKAAKQCHIETYHLVVDLNGPEVRIGALTRPLNLKVGDKITLGSQEIPVPLEVLSVLSVKDSLLIDDGRIQGICQSCDGESAKIEIVRGGTLFSHKSLAIENKEVHLPTLSKKDYQNIAMMKDYPISGVMLPFVRNKEDLLNLREALHKENLDHIRIYAKIENKLGVEHLEEFVDLCDEVVIARGDLGNAMPLWQLPATQKKIAKICKRHRCPFMVVTQLLDSMIVRPVPTRAEVSDIFNAVLDGASSLMVTGETAIGQYPQKVMMYLVNTGQEALEWLKERNI